MDYLLGLNNTINQWFIVLSINSGILKNLKQKKV
jgi:hypothetical protein